MEFAKGFDNAFLEELAFVCSKLGAGLLRPMYECSESVFAL